MKIKLTAIGSSFERENKLIFIHMLQAILNIFRKNVLNDRRDRAGLPIFMLNVSAERSEISKECLQTIYLRRGDRNFGHIT